MNANQQTRQPLYFVRSLSHGGTVTRSPMGKSFAWSNDAGAKALTLRFFDRDLAARVASVMPNAEVYAPLSLVAPSPSVIGYVSDSETFAADALGEVAK